MKRLQLILLLLLLCAACWSLGYHTGKADGLSESRGTNNFEGRK